MWPRSAEYLYPGLDPRLFRFHEDDPFAYYIRMLERIADCLETWTYMDLDQDSRIAPGVFLFNWIENPLFCDTGNDYGVGHLKGVLKRCRRAKKLLKKSMTSRRRGSFGIAEDFYNKAILEVIDLERPASFIINDALQKGPAAMAKAVRRLCVAGEEYLKQQREQPGNIRAQRIAIRLLAILDFYDRGRWRCEGDAGDRLYRYRKCLAEMFEVIGISATASYYAELALACPPDDEEIQTVKKCLSSI